ncbi:MAG: amine oxidase [Myxococcaceae bacterium]|nr:amine oxidase [Myxococcaceae bacterium]
MISRRRCLGLLGALPVALSACAGSAESDASSAAEAVQTRAAGRYDVVIIGAGMAGLRAAQVLLSAGKNVVVLEARDRIGGRIRTDRTAFGVPIELGASWFHDGTHNPLVAVAKSARVETVASDYSESVWRDGAMLSAADSDAMYDTFQKQIKKATKATGPDVSVRTALEGVIGELSLADRDAFEFEIATNVDYDQGEQASLVSARRYNDDGSFSEVNNRIVKGYEGIVAAVGKAIPVKTGETVKLVAQKADHVEVHSTSGVFTAERVIVTLPVGVLQSGSVEFSPPLSARKTGVISRIGMGCLSKTFLRFPSIFWPTESDFVSRVPAADDRGNWACWINLGKLIGAPVLGAINGGAHARKVEGSSDEDNVRDAMAALRTMFPDAPDPIGILQTRWSHDPLALGSYSYMRVGALPGDRAAMGEPEGAVWFAGEACSVGHAGTTHGAYLSGEATAQALLRG